MQPNHYSGRSSDNVKNVISHMPQPSKNKADENVMRATFNTSINAIIGPKMQLLLSLVCLHSTKPIKLYFRKKILMNFKALFALYEPLEEF